MTSVKALDLVCMKAISHASSSAEEISSCDPTEPTLSVLLCTSTNTLLSLAGADKLFGNSSCRHAIQKSTEKKESSFLGN